MAENGERIPRDKVHHPKKRAVLAAYALTANQTVAAVAADVNRGTVGRWLKEDADFAAAMAEAAEEAADRIEAEIIRRGVKGVTKNVWHNGKIVGQELHYSDVLLIFFAKAMRPEKYRDRYEISGPGGGPLQIEAVRAAARSIMGDPDSCEIAVRLVDRQVELADQNGEQTPAFPRLPGGNGKDGDDGNGNGQEQEK